ncbi:suppressor of cytokine signaling 1b [Cyclopterus lumpus]|uniref:Suppressor of cytokine signaling 1b n=1 Tax=Cyclopterus lumpus TaxID=8103 RepID=A0A8C2WHS0_CYCLU|nr:suppressor of cytokine signaling 1b [Cyclopterus lumpus]
MVRDNLDGAAETQNQSQPAEGEPAETERAQGPERGQPESPEPTESQLDLLLNFHEDAETWSQPITGNEAEGFPTHLRPFSSAAEYKLVKKTYQQLQHSGYYWGSIAMEAAHDILTRAQPGTFLVRDSGQPDVFFTLSYQSADGGPTSVRVQLNNLLFGLHGSHRTFASFFALLTHYTGSSCKLTSPYRKQRPERLKQMCRRALIGSHGAEKISGFPGLSTQVKDYIQAYPCCI